MLRWIKTRPRLFLVPLLFSFIALASCGRVDGTAGDSGIGIAGYLAEYNGTNTLTSSPVFANSGRIGIGTTAPAFTLDVNGSVNSALGYYVGGVALITWLTSQTNVNYVGNKVGIGTATPQSALDVSGGVTIGSGATYAGTTAAPANGMIVQGNVGIGTNAPAAPLDVNGHISDSDAGVPVLGACGVGPTITGNDTRGTITFVAGTPSCTITFATAFATAPYCVVTPYGADLGDRVWVTSTSTTQLVIGLGALGTGTQISYICLQ